MKYLSLLLAFALSIGSVFSQEETDQDVDLNVKACAYDGGVNLRWTPGSYQLWKDFHTSGYTLLRVPIKDAQGLEFDSQDRVDMTETLLLNQRPFADWQDWERSTTQIDKASLGFKIYNTDSLKYSPSANRNLKDALKAYENQESQYLFAALICDGDFGLAQASALGFRDETAIQGYTYRYALQSISQSELFISSVIYEVDTDDLPRVSGLKGKGGDLVINLEWATDKTDQFYTFYNIERSNNGGPFTKVNDEAHIGVSDDVLKGNSIYFTDSILSNDVVYSYRVIGISPFGFDGPPSDTLEIQGIYDRLSLVVDIDSIVFSSEEQLQISWSVTGEVEDVDHIDIFYTEDKESPWTQLNSQEISPSTSMYNGTPLQSTAYYYLLATDIHGNTYESIPVLGQAPDISPPAPPVGLNGRIWNDGRVDISWQANSETDLEGYKVLFSNQENGTYTQLTVDHVDSTFYVARIDPLVAMDSMYYRVIAIDKRYNMSEMSEVLALERPDLNPPSKSYLAQISAKEEGVRIAWKLSEDDDVSQYVLQRRTQSNTLWKDVVEFTPDDHPLPPSIDTTEKIPSNYLDEAELEFRTYVYRILAKDDNGNVSASNERLIKPFDNGNRGGILNEDAEIVLVYTPKEEVNPNPNGGSVPQLTNNNIEITSYKDGPIPENNEKAVMVIWHYKTDFPSSILEFKLYRRFKAGPGNGQTNNQVITYPWVAVETLSALEADDLADLVSHDGYMALDYPNVDEDKPNREYDYKVIALHKDGGFSEFSKEVVVEF